MKAAIDIETEKVGFFKRRSDKDFAGHPRLSKFLFQSIVDRSSEQILNTPTIPEGDNTLVFHNAGFDLLVLSTALSKHPWAMRGKFEDTAILAKLLGENSGLKDLTRRLLNRDPMAYVEAAQLDLDTFHTYCRDDARNTFDLHDILFPKIRDAGLEDLYRCELDFSLVNQECEINGLGVDTEKLDYEIKYLEELKVSYCKKLNDLKENFNPNSAKQLKKLLYVERALPIARSKRGITVSLDVLKKILETHEDPYLRAIVAYRDGERLLRQLKSFRKFIDPKNRKVYPYIHTMGAATGRCTSTNPNLQNLSKSSPIREWVVASPGYKLICLDFAQIEPRVLAHLLGPSNFSKIFDDFNADFYIELSRLIYEKTSIQVNRPTAKQLVLALLYGMSPKTISDNLKIPLAQANLVMDSLFKTFPEIKDLEARLIEESVARGFTETVLKRRRYFPEFASKDKTQLRKATRRVLNSVVQGSAADIFKYQLVQLRKGLPLEVKFLMHVHDEVLLEVPEQIAESILNKSISILEEPTPFFRTVPLKVEGKIGSSWKEAKP